MNDPCVQSRREVRLEAGGQVLADLQSLLDRQVDLARQGRLADVEMLAQESKRLVDRLDADEAGKTAEFGAARAAVEDSYRRLLLMLASERDDVHRRLRQLQRVRRAARTYRGRIEQL